MKLFSKIVPVGFIFLAWFIFASPYFIQHKIPYPSRFQVSFFTPWNAYPQYAGPVKNNALSDVVDELYPWKHFSIESLKRGQLPLWNPYSFSGTPQLANYQSAVLSPFNLLFFILPFVDAWSILILLQPLLAGFFMYLFLKSLKISVWGAVLGSVAFMFCGFMVTWMAYGTMAMAMSFLPLMLFCIENTFQKRRLSLLILLVVSIATCFFSGHFQISLYVLGFSLAYLLFKLFVTGDLRSFLTIVAGCLVGIVLSLLQITPSLELYALSSRSGLFSNAGGIALQYLVTIFAPDFFGNPVTRNDWFGYYAEWASFIGIIPLTLAFVSVYELTAVYLFEKYSNSREFGLRRDQARTALFFLVAGLVALVLALNTPLQNVLSLLKIPVLSTSIPSRIIVLFSFSFCVLAGFGLDDLLHAIETRENKKVFPSLILVSIVIVGVWSILSLHILPHDKTMLAIRNLLLPSFLFLLFIIVVLLSYLSARNAQGIEGGGLLRRAPYGTWLRLSLGRLAMTKSLIWLLVMLTLLDSLRYASKWMPFDPSNFIFPKVPVISAMQKAIGQGRVYGDFGAYIDTYYHLSSIEGYDPLSIGRYAEFLASATMGTPTPVKRSLATLDRRAKYADRVLDLLGVTTIYQPKSYINEPWGFPVWDNPKKYSMIYEDDKFQLFRNNTAMPRTALFTDYEVINDNDRLIKTFYSDTFDFRHTLLLESDPNISRCQGCAGGKTKVISYTANRVVISATTTRPALLFLSDSYYPFWEVTVNGRRSKIYEADYAFRAVSVPAGSSTVIFYIRGLL